MPAAASHKALLPQRRADLLTEMANQAAAGQRGDAQCRVSYGPVQGVAALMGLPAVAVKPLAAS